MATRSITDPFVAKTTVEVAKELSRKELREVVNCGFFFEC